MKIALVLSAVALAGLAVAQSISWTSTDDFNQGTYFNTNSATDGELRLNQTGTAPLPYINVPVGGRELANRGWFYTPGRLIRINTLTGEIVGEYFLTPSERESAPSRAVVDRFGNCWITNRYESSGTVAVTKIGILIGGRRHLKIADGLYVPDAFGEYVKDPIFTTGVDRDGDGYIRTSTGKLGNILPWRATAGKDLDSSLPEAAVGTVQEAADELILVYKLYNSTFGQSRSIAIDAEDNIWIGGGNGSSHFVWKVDGQDGKILDKFTHPSMRSGYNMFIDRGKLYSSYAASGSGVLDIATKTFTPGSGTGAADVSVFSPLGNGDMILTHNQNTQNGRLSFMNPSGQIYKQIDTPGSTDKRGIVIDLSGDIWYAARGLWAGGDQKVYRVKQDGTLVSSFVTGRNPCGLGLDSEGNIWVTHVLEAWATKIDPKANGGLGAIVGNVYVGTGSYNYSDGTGATTSVTSRDGEWRATHDSFRPGLTWGVPDWDATVPAKTGLEVFMRAADTVGGLIGKPFLPVSKGVDTNGVHVGRFLEVRVRMSRAADAPATLSPEFRSMIVRYAKGTFSGQVGLNNWLPKAFPNAVFELINPVNNAVLETRNIPLGPFGAFGFKTNLRGQILLRVKSSHWLRSVQPFAQNHTDPGTHGLAFALINGDCDGDNYIGTDDYLVLNDAFDTLAGDAGYDERADLDGDGYVGTDDYLIFSASFDQSGD